PLYKRIADAITAPSQESEQMMMQTLELPTLTVDLVKAARKTEGTLSRESDEELESAVRRYHMWLYLVRKYPEAQVSPSRDIDEIWHLHMLHPRAYFEDCMRIFGEILDHDGGFGLGSADEWNALNQ